MNSYSDTCQEKSLDFLTEDNVAVCLRLPLSMSLDMAKIIASFSRKQGIDALFCPATISRCLLPVFAPLPVILHTTKAVADILPQISEIVSGIWHDNPDGGMRIGSFTPAEIAWQEVIEYMHLRGKKDYLVSFDTSVSHKFDERLKQLAGWTGGMVLTAGYKGKMPALESVQRASELAPHCPLFINSSLQDVDAYLPYLNGVILDLTSSNWNSSVIGKYVTALKNKALALSR